MEAPESAQDSRGESIDLTLTTSTDDGAATADDDRSGGSSHDASSATITASSLPAAPMGLGNRASTVPLYPAHHSNANVEAFDNDRLERHGRWLLSIPRDDVLALRRTPEYAEFLRAFERLGHAHRKAVAHNRSLMQIDEIEGREPMRTAMTARGGVAVKTAGGAAGPSEGEGGGGAAKPPGSSSVHHRSGMPSLRTKYSFLQHLAVDDVILRVFEFLECHSLTRTSVTCSRFRELANRSATQRTQHTMMSGTPGRMLGSVMKLLRAKEQIEGVGPVHGPFVRVPMLGLSRRVIVTDAGDPEYNGIYFCTGSNGNGFIFTKPRVPERRVGVASDPHRGAGVGALEEGLVMPVAAANVLPPGVAGAPPDVVVVNAEGEETQPGQLLRCVIAKRFSNETILWYMSKEIDDTSSDSSVATVGEVKQVFSFWAKLMVIGDATPDICRYPSQTSILSRNGDPAWQPLSSTRSTNPPTVELLD